MHKLKKKKCIKNVKNIFGKLFVIILPYIQNISLTL